MIRKFFNLIFQKCFAVSYDLYVASRTYRSFDSMALLLKWMLGEAKSYDLNFSLVGKKVLEVGPGSYVSHALAMKMLGAKTVLSIDKFRQHDPKASQTALNYSVHAKKVLSDGQNFDVVKVLNNLTLIKASALLGQLKQFGVDYKAPYTIEDLSKLNESYDVIFSYTVLEHIPQEEVESFLKSSIQTLAPKGYFIHYIDLEDHLDSNRPFDFLRLNRWSAEDCFSRGNRMRASWWKNKFNALDGVDFRFLSKVTRGLNINVDHIDGGVTYLDTTDLETTGLLVLGQRLD